MNATGRAPRILGFTTLYPSIARPRHGIFIETRLRHILRAADIDARVLAPLPWFPSGRAIFGRYADLARTPQHEIRHGIQIFHPRYFMLPGIGAYRQHRALADCALKAARQIQQSGWDFDLIDAHYAYPDGVAAAILAARLGKPFIITFRGTDINVLARLPQLGSLIRAASEQAAALVSVSAALRDAAIELGMPAEKIQVIRNGVDLETFSVSDPRAGRARIGLGDRPLVAGVGNLITDKRFDILLQAAARLPDLGVALVGDGPERASLIALAAQLGIERRVRFLPVMSQQALAEIYSAIDVLALTSLREGWPNVLLEAMACGAPVLAVDVGGVREILRDPVAGLILDGADAQQVANGLVRILARKTDRAALRSYASKFGWDEVVHAQASLFERVCAKSVQDTSTALIGSASKRFNNA